MRQSLYLGSSNIKFKSGLYSVTSSTDFILLSKELVSYIKEDNTYIFFFGGVNQYGLRLAYGYIYPDGQHGILFFYYFNSKNAEIVGINNYEYTLY